MKVVSSSLFYPSAGFRFLKIPIILLLLILFSSTPLINAECKYEAIFNFGDSNSETGGFWAAFPAQHDPYGMTFFKKPAGRASDGRAVIDFIAQALGLPFLSPYLQSIGSNFRHGANFATASSTVLLPNTSLFVTGVSPFSLAIQLNQMKELKRKVLELGSHSKLPPKTIFSRSIYTLDIGHNDFTGNVGAIGINGIKRYMQQVAYQIALTIKELYDIGGRTFLVMNLAPIGCFPSSLTELPHDSSDLDSYGCMVSYNNAVEDYNILLKETLYETQNQLTNAYLVYVDTYSIKLDLFRHPKDHGFIFGTKACCGSGGGYYNFNPQVFCGDSKVINGINITATACNDPKNYVSWDGIHLTDAANRLIALAILNGTYFDSHFPLFKLCDLHPIGLRGTDESLSMRNQDL